MVEREREEDGRVGDRVDEHHRCTLKCLCTLEHGHEGGQVFGRELAVYMHTSVRPLEAPELASRWARLGDAAYVAERSTEKLY